MESGELRKLNELTSLEETKALELFTNVWGAGNFFVVLQLVVIFVVNFPRFLCLRRHGVAIFKEIIFCCYAYRQPIIKQKILGGVLSFLSAFWFVVVVDVAAAAAVAVVVVVVVQGV